MPRPRGLVILLGALVLAAPLSAQITAKQALAQLKSANKARLKELKAAGKDALAALDVALIEFVADSTPQTPPSDAASNAGGMLSDFVAAANSAYAEALLGL